MILDGVTVGDHSVVGAGAVVTDDVAPYRVVGGNPAQVIRDRRADGRSGAADGSAESVSDDLPAALASFGERAAEQLDAVLERYRDDDTYLDGPGADRTVRAPCDAIEVAGMFDVVPAGRSRDAWVSWLRGLQDPETGLFPDPDGSPDPDADPRELPRAWDRYHILAVGYALEVLGATPDHRISAVDALTPDALYDRLDGLPWDDHAWRCGDWIDCYGTALYFNHRYFDGRRSPASVFGWLETNVDPDSGLWGEPTTDQGWLQPVNGFYRLTRGTYAQFGIDVPAPERAIDTVLCHARESAAFRDERLNACNVLDVIHPLWLCGKQTAYRRDEARQWARDRLPIVLDAWQQDQGFGFRLAGDDPSLQGTEMWLSIVYLLADLCGWADALGYRPWGVHRTDVPLDLQRR